MKGASTRGRRRSGPLRAVVIAAVLLLPGCTSRGESNPEAREDPSPRREDFDRGRAGSEPGRPVLLPDVGPRPREVVVSVNTARRASLRNAELVTGIVNGLPLTTIVHVLTNDRAALAVAREGVTGRVRFIELPADDAITIWPQDPFLVLRPARGDGPPTLLTSKEFERAGDRAMAERIARHAGFDLRASELHFEGGNLVSDEQHVLLGENTVRHNARVLGVDAAEVVVRFEEELGRRVLVVGPYPQPVAHLDMIVTPLGGGRLAVADSALGARLAEDALAEDPESVEAFERLCEERFFGNARIRELALREGGTARAPRLAGETRTMIELSHELAPVLDGIAGSLDRSGYQVERVPFLFGGPESREAGDFESAGRAGYPMLTYNNVLLEDDLEGPVVYLPAYGLDALDRAAARAWRAIGFAPRVIDGFQTSAMYGGALRCAVKVLSR